MACTYIVLQNYVRGNTVKHTILVTRFCTLIATHVTIQLEANVSCRANDTTGIGSVAIVAITSTLALMSMSEVPSKYNTPLHMSR